MEEKKAEKTMFWMPPNHDTKCWYHDLIGHWSSFHGNIHVRTNVLNYVIQSGGRIKIDFEVTEGGQLSDSPRAQEVIVLTRQ